MGVEIMKNKWLRVVTRMTICAVCNQRRSSEYISIIEGRKASDAYGGPGRGYYYLYYCNDKEDCIAEAVKARIGGGNEPR